MLVFINSIGFEKSLELMELLGFDKMIELTHKISKMHLPHYVLESEDQKHPNKKNKNKTNAKLHAI